MTLKKRIDRLEKQNAKKRPLAIISIYVDPTGADVPVDGYELQSGDRILRMSGESSNELITRSSEIALQNSHGSCSHLVPVVLLPDNGRDPEILQ